MSLALAVCLMALRHGQDPGDPLGHIKVWIGVWGAKESEIPGLAVQLGEGYGVMGLIDRQVFAPEFPGGSGALAEEDPSKRRIVVYVPAVPKQTSIDGYTMELKRNIRIFRKMPAPRDVFVCIPAARGPQATFLSSYVIPLTRQAARESGAKVIDLGSGDTFAQAVADAVADPRLEKKDWKLVSVDSQQIDEGPARDAIDGNPDTYWHTQYDPTTPKPPHQIEVDLGEMETIDGFRYLPRQDGGVNGRVKGYEFYVSQDGQKWIKAASGSFPNTSQPTRVRLEGLPVVLRYFRFVATSEQNGGPWTSVAEIDMLRTAKR